ncbi:hypothetical protein [Embleya sp. NPDC001921]
MPATAFAGIARRSSTRGAHAFASSPSHLRRFDPKVRHVLLAALLFRREREITDTLVELVNSTAGDGRPHRLRQLRLPRRRAARRGVLGRHVGPPAVAGDLQRAHPPRRRAIPASSVLSK